MNWMTVQQLIDALQKVQNKEATVGIYSNSEESVLFGQRVVLVDDDPLCYGSTVFLDIQEID